jgi:hypothetical protein
MKRFILILILTFNFQSWTIADDIRDFQIEGMSIGDSLLDHFSIEELKKQLKKTRSTYTSKKIKRTWFVINSESYEQITVHYKNDGSYKIVNIGGTIVYNKDNMSECFVKMDKVVNDIEVQLPSAKKIDKGKRKHSRYTKTYITNVVFKLKKGEIYIACTDWDKDTENKFKWNDNLSVELDSLEFLKWLNNEAYK